MSTVYARAWVIVCAVSLAGVAHASDLAPEVAKLFESGTKNTPPAVAGAQQQYDALKRQAGNDARVDYAYALVLANQRKYTDAIPPLMRYIRAQPSDVRAISTIAWLFVQERRPADAMSACGAIARRFPNEPGAQPRPELIVTAELTGALFAYLELVRPDTIDAKSVAACKNEVVARLGKSYLDAFDQGRVALIARLEALATEHEEKQKRTDERVQQRQEKAKSLLGENKQKLATESKAIQASTEQLQDAQRELALIQQQFSTSTRDRERVAAQIVILQAQILQLQIPGEGPITRNTVVIDPNSSVRNTTTSRNTSIDIGRAAQINAIAITLASLNKQAFELDNRILGMRSRAAELTARVQTEGQTRADSMAIAGQALKRAGALEKQVAREKVSKAPRNFVPVGRAASIATYVAFPYDQERERVLGWFK